jgi:NAD(P)-dependent dehydrogenase (short-subunit alcohol dehydrogenase family)
MGFLGFFYRQLSDKPSPTPTSISLAGQTAIVTGSNVGLGLEAARQLIEHKLSRLILAVRSSQNGESAKIELQKKHPECAVEVWELDQNSFASVTAFAKRANGLDRLDLVVLNAGVMKRKYVQSASGHELHLQVNYLATALLTLSLLPALKKTAKLAGRPSHMTVVTSELHMWTSFKQRSAPNLFHKLDDKAAFSPDHYNVSKLLGVLWAQELASRTPSTEVVINTVNPGLCWSSLHRDDENFGFRVFKHMCAWSSEQGAYCIVDAAIAKQAESHGCYLSEQKVTP